MGWYLHKDGTLDQRLFDFDTEVNRHWPSWRCYVSVPDEERVDVSAVGDVGRRPGNFHAV